MEIGLLEYKNKISRAEQIDSLVFSGGGAKGLAYAGVVDELGQRGILTNIKRVAGASAGAIIAMVFGLGYNPTEIINIIESTDFAKFLDCKGGVDLNAVLQNPLKHPIGVAYLGERLIAKGALCDGLVAREFLTKLIENKQLSKNINFKELYGLTGIELNIVCCDVSRKETIIHNHKNSPNLSVLDAVHTSMSIPLIFKPVDLYHDGTTGVDGGTTDNYPLDAVLNPLGFILTTKEDVMKTRFTNIRWAFDYIIAMIEMLGASHNNEIFSKQENIDRTIFIDTLGIGALDFNMTSEQITALIESGRKSVSDYFSDQK
jgi:NTE family protein